MIQTRIVFLCFAFLFYPQFSSSDEYFDNLREDQSVPEHCSKTAMDFFESTPNTFTVGIEHSKDSGFDREVAISRQGAKALWRKIMGTGKGGDFERAVDAEPRLLEYYVQMKDKGGSLGFDFKSEGDILEFLYLLKLKNSDKSDLYYYTSAVAYHKAYEQNFIGELDIVVGLKDTCEIVGVGEAKLGVDSLGKAHSQLYRFTRFLRNSISSLFGF